MNQLELYKRLPKKNCGKCRADSCMSFAFSVISGESEVAECPVLAPGDAEELNNSVKRFDWRADLIRKIGEEVRGMDFMRIAHGIGAEFKGDHLIITCMGRDFCVSKQGEVSARGGASPWIKILLLHYIRTAGSAEPSGRWVSYRDLRAGLVKASSFSRECEEPIREMFDQNPDATRSALESLGALKAEGMPSEFAWRLGLLPRIEILILYWPAEEEFPSKVKILLDSTADTFLDVESLMFLVEGLVKNLERLRSHIIEQ